jgi:hypothetical protein
LIQSVTGSPIDLIIERLNGDFRMIEIFIKLLNRGLRLSDYDKFPFQIQEGSSIRELINDLMKNHGEAFKVYLEDDKKKVLNYNAIVLVNGKMIAAGWKLKRGLLSIGVFETELFDGDTIVFMIAIGGG